jgi:hypothetical protein
VELAPCAFPMARPHAALGPAAYSPMVLRALSYLLAAIAAGLVVAGGVVAWMVLLKASPIAAVIVVILTALAIK